MVTVALEDPARAEVRGERQVIAERLAALREQAERVRLLADRLDRDVEGAVRRLREVDELLGLAPQLPLDSLDIELTGQRLRTMAITILRRRLLPGDVVHYRDWYAFLVEEGGRVGGQDPLATFLTQISRSAEVESVRSRSGLYRLRAA